MRQARISVTAATRDNTRSGQAADHRFNKADRLLDAASFGRVFQKARRSKDRYFTVLYRGNGDQAARLGLAVSKKNCRSAVGRNRLKRVVRESFRQNKAALRGLDIVVLNQSATHRADNSALFASLARHWRTLNGDRGRANRETRD